jgi:hypothetical protein
MSLYIEQLADKYPHQLVQIIGPGTNLEGIITSESMNVAGSASTDIADAVDLDNLAKGVVSGVVGKIAGDYGKSKVAKHFNSLRASSQGWVRGGKLVFSVSFTVFESSMGTGRGYNHISHSLAQMTQSGSSPTESKQSPVYYDILAYEEAIKNNDFGAIEAQLFRVQIGEWFNAPLLIPTSTSAEYSTYTDDGGIPLYCVITCGFESYRDLNASETGRIISK